MTAGNDKKELRAGEKFVVTVQEVLHNTLMVHLEYRRVKFCGVLLNTTNRQGPYGISEKPFDSYCHAYGIDPKSIAEQEKNELKKAENRSTPQYPPPIQTRTTYAQKLHLPPPRQIHQRRRRSKRKVRMDMMDTDLALKWLSNSQNGKVHSETCCCDRCAVSTIEDTSIKGKRKLLPDPAKVNLKRKSSGSYDDMTTIQAKPKQSKIDSAVASKPSAATSRSNKPLAKSHNPTATSVKRSPVIKISYKSPGGKGQVLKIPSKVHSSASRVGNASKKALQQRAQKVIRRAKSEHLKFIHDQNMQDNKDTKPAVLIANKKVAKSFEAVVIAKTNVTIHKKDSSDTNASSSSVVAKTDDREKPLSRKVVTPKVETEREKSPSDNYNEQSKRLLRSLAPHVVISPISKNIFDEETSSNLASLRDTSQNEDTVASGENTQSLSPKKKDVSKLSHTISVTRCKTRDGVQWCQGDVVWGKIHGFPWWPGLLKSIVVKKGHDSMEQTAVVDWFQCKTISHIPCSQLESFTGNFKKRYSKKIKGRYKKAIREAREAEKQMSREVRQLIMQFET